MPRHDESSHPEAIDEEVSLLVAGSWLRALTEGSRELVALLGADGRLEFLSMSGAAKAILGYESLELSNIKLARLLHPLDIERVIKAFRRVADTSRGRATVRYRARHKSGRYLQVESTAVNQLADPLVNAVVVHTRKRAERPKPAARLSASEVDNDAAAQRGIRRALKVAMDRAAIEPYGFSLLMVEVERPRGLAQAYGEETLVAVRAEVGRRVRAMLRPIDGMGKLEGGHLVMLDGVADRALAERVAARVRETVGTRFQIQGRDVLAAIVIGVVTNERHYERPDDMLRDALLAVSKARGSAGIASFRTQLQVEHARQLTLAAEITGALQRGEFRVYYLPTVSLATRTLSGFEALLRWHHPERGVLLPEVFIPVAEQTGVIKQLGRWSLLQACQQTAAWQRAYRRDSPLTMSVNVAAGQFAEFDFDDQLSDILSNIGMDPNLLSIELNEHAATTHPEAVEDALGRMRKRGIRITLDNFGVGTSSFSTLRRLPLDGIKIDRALVQPLVAGGRDRDAVRAAIEMAHSLSLEVTAQGVSSAAHAAQLGQMMCEFAQGYLFGKPTDSDAAAALIASYPGWWQ